MFTSNFAKYRFLPKDLTPISISRRPPYWWKGRQELRLAPLESVLFADSWEAYREGFQRQMDALDVPAVYQSLPENAVLLCFEPAGCRCHRRWVAELFEAAMGVQIPEFGFAREDCPAFSALLTKVEFEAAKRKSARKPRK